MSKALIDGDILVYRAGFAVQGQEEPPYPPNSHAKQAFKYIVEGIKRELNPTSIEIHLSPTGKENFRYEVAKTRQYKGNRKKQSKPVYYDYLRAHVLMGYPHVVAKGAEADDSLGIAQGEGTVIVSIDKDLDMIPGEHYNFVSKKRYTISKNQAFYNFCFQLLTGDSTDNIPGLPGIGPKKAEEILKRAKRDKKRMLECAALAYHYKMGDKAHDYFEEQAKLIWIMRERGKPFMITREMEHEFKIATDPWDARGPRDIRKKGRPIEEIVCGKQRESKKSSP